jgi:competence protein ComEC
MQYGARSILFSGDIERRAEAQLAPLLPHFDVLKVPHHGSATSSTEPFLRAVTPQLAIISCAADSRFGFPHPSVLARYRALGVDVWGTASDGLITLRTDGRTWEASGFASHRSLRLTF